ncbi:MAG: YihY family inner membrane protein [Xanthomonadales bacterium]|jgi:membrane protein|nr:YihY family inner membrane protein [Xanthomonadales bacterium]
MFRSLQGVELLGHYARLVWAGIGHFGRFLRLVWQRFVDDRCLEAAGSLALTSLFAVVPLGAVSLALISAFPQFEVAKERILGFAIEQLVPTAAQEVGIKLREFFNAASQLTATSIVALVISAILLMDSIEGAFNRIWHVPTARPPLARFVVFWTALTLGPLALAASLAISTYLFSLPLVQQSTIGLEIDPLLEQTTLVLAPVAIELIAFTLLFWIVPNRSVRLSHALVGGLLAALSTEAAKRVFAWYLREFPATQQIYGALAAIPFFILWIYILWVIVLVCAEIAAGLASFRLDEGVRVVQPGERLPLLLRLLAQLRAGQREGYALSAHELKSRIPGLTDEFLQEALADLARLKVAQRTELGDWVLVRDLNTITLLPIYESGHYPLPAGAACHQTDSEALRRTLERLRTGTNTMICQPLERLIDGIAPAKSDGE